MQPPRAKHAARKLRGTVGAGHLQGRSPDNALNARPKLRQAGLNAVVTPKPTSAPPTEPPEQLRARVRASLFAPERVAASAPKLGAAQCRLRLGLFSVNELNETGGHESIRRRQVNHRRHADGCRKELPRTAEVVGTAFLTLIPYVGIACATDQRGAMRHRYCE